MLSTYLLLTWLVSAPYGAPINVCATIFNVFGMERILVRVDVLLDLRFSQQCCWRFILCNIMPYREVNS